MTLTIVPTYLRVTAILPQTNAKHSFFNDSLTEHNIINRSEKVLGVASTARHSQYSICQLCIEVVSFFFYAPKRIHKPVLARVCTLSKVNLIFYDVTIVHTSLSVPLIKLAATPVDTTTRLGVTLK
jgi:hypothetical protein